MKRVALTLFAAALVSLLLAACSAAPPTVQAPPVAQTPPIVEVPPIEIGIHASPSPMRWMARAMAELPVYDPGSPSPWQIDLRHLNVRGLNLADRLTDLLHASFDQATVWPAQLPAKFDPVKIMELAKNPGLGVRQLQAEGVTGKGIGIAIIDQLLLTGHVEYKDQLRHYEELVPNTTKAGAQMHGAAVASIAVGKTVGVATEADLYFLSPYWRQVDGQTDFAELAKAVDRVVAINRQLPKEKKIRVLSISIGWGPTSPGYAEMEKAVDNAKKDDIFVVTSSLSRTYPGLFFHGLGRDPRMDPEAATSYGPGSWWAESYYQTGQIVKRIEALLIPMDSRCVADPSGVEEYVFYSDGGWSWCTPYIAGLYAMACEVKRDITPYSFWAAALATGDTVTLSKDGRTYKFGKIVNPTKLIETLTKPN